MPRLRDAGPHDVHPEAELFDATFNPGRDWGEGRCTRVSTYYCIVNKWVFLSGQWPIFIVYQFGFFNWFLLYNYLTNNSEFGVTGVASSKSSPPKAPNLPSFPQTNEIQCEGCHDGPQVGRDTDLVTASAQHEFTAHMMDIHKYSKSASV